jgi:hypothetical protein
LTFGHPFFAKGSNVESAVKDEGKARGIRKRFDFQLVGCNPENIQEQFGKVV